MNTSDYPLLRDLACQLREIVPLEGGTHAPEAVASGALSVMCVDPIYELIKKYSVVETLFEIASDLEITEYVGYEPPEDLMRQLRAALSELENDVRALESASSQANA